MMRPKDQAAAEKEARLQEAIAAVKNKQNRQHTCYSAAKAFNVPPRTFYDRVNGGKKPRNQAHERDQNLTHAEEKELVRWITLLTISGYPPRYETLRRLAEIIRERRVKTGGGDQIQMTVYDQIGEQWVQHFLRRHPELASVRSHSIDAVRVKAELTAIFISLPYFLISMNLSAANLDAGKNDCSYHFEGSSAN